MSSVTESRGVHYCAEAGGTRGNVRCQVIRRWLVLEQRAQYSIVVCNETDADAQASAFVPDPLAGTRRTIVHTTIGQRSDFSTSVVLELSPPGIMPELRVALTSGDACFTLEVPALATDFASAEGAVGVELRESPGPAVPAARALPALVPDLYTPPAYSATPASPPLVRTIVLEPRRRGSPPVFPMFAGFVLLLGGIGFVIGRPQIGQLAVPRTAAAGAGIDVGYRATGLGSAAYDLMGPDGTSLARGALTLGAGTFTLTVPRAPGVPAYLVRLTMVNPLGSTSAERYVHVSMPAALKRSPAPIPVHRSSPPAAPPQIRSLALDRSTLASGETLTVYYDVDAAGGSIALYDPASQITYGRSAIAASGHSAFVAPRVDATRFLTVVATARRGPATTQSRIGVTITAPDPAAGFPDPSSPAAEAPGNVTDGSVAAGMTAISAPSSVRSGLPVAVDIRGATDGLEVVFLDGTGREVGRRDVPAGGRRAAFTAPTVRVPTRYVLEATYPHGVGSETVVRAITVVP